VQPIIVDGEAVWCEADGMPDFDKLHSHGYDNEVILYGSDLLELNGEDYRSRPLQHNNLACGSLSFSLQII